MALEALTAALLLARAAPRLGAALGCGLLALYAGVIAVNLLRGRRDVDCGCAGPAARQPLSGWLLARNGALFGLGLAGIATPGARPLQWLDAFTVAVALAAAMLAYGALNRLLANAPKLESLRG
jgi:hypothetical protein